VENLYINMDHLKHIFIISLVLLFSKLNAQTKNDEKYRPQIHFSPKDKWMNDPNGMVYHNGIYHLFYQYYPDSNVWGPMHWGHATSEDMIHWKHQSIALYPDSLGYIFSGSAVVDVNNTSGFAVNGKAPLVAIFTHHDPNGEASGKNDYQYQSIAYSIDDGKSWIKYKNNPVVRNPGIKDFRDPKVMWFAKEKKWIMTLATLDRITFYSSNDLKNWTKESEFGENAGAHGGVWECPDLLPLDYNGKKVWVLIVSINPGGPNGGSATQYFLGDFDGKNFLPFSTETKWLDYGPDDYAGVTWSNTGNRRIFLGWMSNWSYATVVPTETWRSAMTIPRELKIMKVNKELFVASTPVKEMAAISSKPIDISKKIPELNFPGMIELEMKKPEDFSIVISNDQREELLIGYDKATNRYFIDRTKSGIINFHEEFPAQHFAPRLSNKSKIKISLVIDVSSVELFADDGLTVMTGVFFPGKSYDQLRIQSTNHIPLKSLRYVKLNNIWK